MPALVILLSLLATTEPATAGPVKLAAPGLSMVNLPDDLGVFYSEHLAQQLALAGLEVVTARQIAALVGFERQKELLGCADTSSSCLAELANALGVDGLITGSIGKIGRAYQINVSIISAVDGRQLAAHSKRVTSEEEVLDELTLAGRGLAQQTLHSLRGTAAPPLPSPEPANLAATQPGPALRASSWKDAWWAPAAAGGLGLVVGAISWGSANDTFRRMEDDLAVAETLRAYDFAELRDQGNGQQVVAVTASLVGVAGAGLAAWMWLTRPAPTGPGAAIWVAPNPSGLTVRGVFP